MVLTKNSRNLFSYDLPFDKVEIEFMLYEFMDERDIFISLIKKLYYCDPFVNCIGIDITAALIKYLFVWH